MMVLGATHHCKALTAYKVSNGAAVSALSSDVATLMSTVAGFMGVCFVL
jgi:hypothetical protein